MRKWLGGGVVALAAALIIAGRPPPSPFTLLDSFDQALSMVTAAAEKRIAEIERRSEHPTQQPRVSFTELVDRVERQVAVAEDAARVELDRALTANAELSPGRRTAVLACIEHHVAVAADDLTRALGGGDGELAHLEVAEYRATLLRLRAVRALVTLRARLV